MSRVYIVAEIGCNHNGDVELAKKMVDQAKACGVDAVKFQTFNSRELISKYAPKADYQKVTTGNDESQLEMTRKLELSHEDYLMLRDYALSLGLDTFSTPFDMESMSFLEESGQSVWKIPSGEITNVPYLERIRDIQCENKEIILSTGMSTIEEIEFAVDILKDSFNTKLTILHCNTEYPTTDEDVNLRAILELKDKFPQYHIGLSDHSVGTIAAIAAVAYEITFIEKHFTLDKNFYGPDHKASATPDELRELCESVRRAEIMLGSKEKHVTSSEAKNKSIARKSIVAKRAIQKGEVLDERNITCKRPGNGISPIHWYEVLGQVAERDFEEDELITLSSIAWEE
ncbi:MAG: N-acetylneuraminate synthase [Clostridiales bacterium]|nr:N-acetylneuraminate synthase [Clostridiales bacterium]